MSAELIYDQSQLLTFVVLLGALLLGSEIGYRVGRRERSARLELLHAQINSLQGALLGLFALLLGFTFSMALSR